MDTATANHKRDRALTPGLLSTVILALGCLSALIYGLNFKLADWLDRSGLATSMHGYMVLFMALSVLYLAAVALIVQRRAAVGRSKWLLAGIIFLAVLFRLFLIPQEPAALSSDMYRFIWDGRVQQNGFNPYQHPPNAEELKVLRDDRIYPHINRKDARTLYPAGAQLFFRGVYALTGSNVTGFKIVMVFFDLATLAVIIALLRFYGLGPSRALVYAWNPLVVFEIAYSGHLEGITVFLIMAAFYLAAIGKRMPGGILLAMASAVKLYPALLLPALMNRGRRIKDAAVFIIVFGLLYIPYINARGKLAGFLPTYLNNPYESFNLGLKYLLMHLFPSIGYGSLSQLFILALIAAGAVIGFKSKRNDENLYDGYLLTGWLIVLMPAALHPWYVILIIPFLAFFISPAWLVFSCAVTLSYLKYASAQGIMPFWVLMCEYMPLVILLSWGFAYRRWALNPAGPVRPFDRRYGGQGYSRDRRVGARP